MRRIAFVLLLLLALPLQAIQRQSLTDYRARRQKLAEKLGDGVLILFAATEEEGQNATRGFRQSNDFYYLTGWAEPGAGLVIAAKPYTEVLFLPAQNVSQEKWTGPKLTAASTDAKKVTGFDRVMALDEMRNELVRILPSPRVTIQTDLAAKSPIDWLRRANAFPNYTTMEDASPLIAALRLTKDRGEIELIRAATDATVAAHKAALKAIRPGMTENELAGIIEFEFRRRGGEGPGFSSIVGSGLNSTVLHYSENSGVLQDGDVVVIDIGAEFSMYVSDVTRTLPVGGKFTPRQREIYEIVLGAQQAAIDAFKTGVSTLNLTAPNSLYKVAYDYINTHGKDRAGKPLGDYFLHGLGHYVGLEVHDAGDNTAPLQPGAVFTIEPGIYIPEERLGVRIEDTFLVGDDGKLVCLSCGAVKTVSEIEGRIGR